MIGTIVNAISIIVSTVIGLLFGNRISEKTSDSIIKGFGLFVIVVGIQGSLKPVNSYILIFSLVIGTFLGEIMKLQDKIEDFGEFLKRKFDKNSCGNKSVAKGFVTATLLFCTGAMAIIGALDAGMKGDNTMLYTKSTLDSISAIVLASSLGWGVGISAICVIIYQGTLTLLGMWLAPILTVEVIAVIGVLGSILLIGLGLNVLEATKLKLMNYVPAVFMPIILYPLFQFISKIFS